MGKNCFKMVTVMKYIGIIILSALLVCCFTNSRTKTNNPKHRSERLTNRNFKKESAYQLWHEIADSIVLFGQSHLPEKLYPVIEEGAQLFCEDTVYNHLHPLCEPGDTVFFIESINEWTAEVSFLFWEKKPTIKTETGDVFFYKYIGKKRPKTKVLIGNDSEGNLFPECLISTCNKWDTKVLETDSHLDEYANRFVHLFAYRIAWHSSPSFSIESVLIKTQNPEVEVSYPYHEIY